jgi:myo-inositol-1(or 4)-monophosphatase
VTFAVTTPDTGHAAVAPRAARFLLSLARRAADAAASVIRDATPRLAELAWREKGAADFVTEVDLAAEARVLEILETAVPGANYLAEETAATLDPERLSRGVTFVIDPLDGTTNFLHGVPDYAVSIGVLVDGVLTAGVVHNVPRNETFVAAAGAGAWLGEERLAVSRIENPARALIGTGFPFQDPADIPEYLEQMARVMAATAGVRRAGAAAIDLASVAAGRLDGFWENVLSPWDIAAGMLLVREAGGVCTNIAGDELRIARSSVVAGNAAIHPWLAGLLRQ